MTYQTQGSGSATLRSGITVESGGKVYLGAYLIICFVWGRRR